MKNARTMLLVCLLFVACLLPETGLAEAAAEATPAIDLTGLINAVIAVLGALVTYRLIPWLKARTTAEQQEMLGAAIRTAVYGAEQLYHTGEISDRLDYAENWLEEHGYTVSRAEIEAAVRQMKEIGQVLTLETSVDMQEEKTDG